MGSAQCDGGRGSRPPALCPWLPHGDAEQRNRGSRTIHTRGLDTPANTLAQGLGPDLAGGHAPADAHDQGAWTRRICGFPADDRRHARLRAGAPADVRLHRLDAGLGGKRHGFSGLGPARHPYVDRPDQHSHPLVCEIFAALARNHSTGVGNYSIGVREQIIFPEIDYDKIDTVRGPGCNHHHFGSYRRRGSRSA